MMVRYIRKPNRQRLQPTVPVVQAAQHDPWIRSETLPSSVVVCHSPHARCGIREYGRQLDEALSKSVKIVASTFERPTEIVDSAEQGSIVLVHYEPTFAGHGFVETLRAIKAKKARVALCCHLFSPQVIAWADHGLVDALVTHRDYGRSARGPHIVQIPLACPVYTPSIGRAELRARFGFASDAIVLTTLGFLAQWKRLPDLLKSLLSAAASDQNFIFQIQTPWPFANREMAAAEEVRVRDVLSRHAGDRVRFSTEFIPERDLLDRVHASDLGFVFHGQHTLSVSAATKQFVSARCPLVITDSTHSSDVNGGIVRVSGFDPSRFASEVIHVARDAAMRERLGIEMAGEYARLNMDTVAAQYLELFRSIGCSSST
jgi:glycosyltransferase involved in cell wall biosynthesis